MILQALLILAPAVLLLGSLLLRRYPGERVIERLRERRRPDRRALAARPPARRLGRPVPRGGRLIAAGLAVRGPPGRMTHTVI